MRAGHPGIHCHSQQVGCATGAVAPLLFSAASPGPAVLEPTRWDPTQGGDTCFRNSEPRLWGQTRLEAAGVPGVLLPMRRGAACAAEVRPAALGSAALPSWRHIA